MLYIIEVWNGEGWVWYAQKRDLEAALGKYNHASTRHNKVRLITILREQ